MIQAVNTLNQSRTPSLNKAEFTPLLFLWLTSGNVDKITCLTDLAEFFHGIHPEANTEEVLKLMAKGWNDHMVSQFQAVAARNPMFDREIYQDAQLLGQLYERQFKKAFEKFGISILSYDREYFRTTSHSATPHTFVLHFQTHPNGNLITMRYVVDQARLTFDGDEAGDFFKYYLHNRNTAQFGRKLINYMLEHGIASQIFDELTEEQMLRLLARDGLTYRYLQRIYNRSLNQDPEMTLKALLAGARRARNVRYGVIAAGLIGGYFLWNYLFGEENPTEEHIEKSIGMLKNKPHWDMKSYLIDLVENTSDSQALVETIRTMGDDTALALWNYVFVPKE